MTLTSFFRKKDLGIGLVGQWVSLALSQMWFVQALMIFVVLLLLQEGVGIFSSQVLNLGVQSSRLVLACEVPFKSLFFFPNFW